MSYKSKLPSGQARPAGVCTHLDLVDARPVIGPTPSSSSEAALVDVDYAFARDLEKLSVNQLRTTASMSFIMNALNAIALPTQVSINKTEVLFSDAGVATINGSTITAESDGTTLLTFTSPSPILGFAITLQSLDAEHRPGMMTVSVGGIVTDRYVLPDAKSCGRLVSLALQAGAALSVPQPTISSGKASVAVTSTSTTDARIAPSAISSGTSTLGLKLTGANAVVRVCPIIATTETVSVLARAFSAQDPTALSKAFIELV